MVGLTTLQVRSAKPGRHPDGRGLYLVVRDTGARAWVARIQADGRRRDFGLGSAHSVSLSEARAAAAELRRRYQGGEQIAPRVASKAKKSTIPSFEEAARACHADLQIGWRNRKHIDSWIACLENHVFPTFGSMRVDQVDSIAVREAMAPIWIRVPETARRALQRIGAVLDYAHVNGWRPTEAALRSVPKGLPRQPRRDTHFGAMPFSEVSDFMTRLNAMAPTTGRDALRYTICTAVRSGETRFAAWPEIDFESRTWTIPAERMKMGKQHAVPLCSPTVALLRRRWDLRSSDNGLVFSRDGERPLSDMTMTKVLRDLGHDEITVHGFRSTFTDWAAEETETPKEVVDKALAHQVPDRVEAAYRRTDFFQKRRALMEAWCEFLESS
jgi:integrase